MATGCLAYGFHEGSRSEYFAQYILSAFGSAQLIARQEDYGIDFFCTLGTLYGKRLHIENYYQVQVKSDSKSIIYSDSMSVKWLTSLHTPLIYCVINKKTSSVELFASVGIALLSSKKSLEEIAVIFDEPPSEFIEVHGDQRPIAEHKNGKVANIFLGKPILSFNINDLESKENLCLYESIIRYWITLDQKNLDNRTKGFTFYSLPYTYKTNQLPDDKLQFGTGNFLDPFRDIEVMENHYQTLYKGLSIQIYKATNERDLNKFKSVASVALKLLKEDPQPKGDGGFYLSSTIFGGCEVFRLEVDPFLIATFGNPEIELVKPY